MSTPTTPATPVLPLTAEEQKTIQELINGLAQQGDSVWRMSVPPRPDDSDVLLQRMLDGYAALQEQVRQLAAASPAVVQIDPETLQKLVEAATEAAISLECAAQGDTKYAASDAAELRKALSALLPPMPGQSESEMQS